MPSPIHLSRKTGESPFLKKETHLKSTKERYRKPHLLNQKFVSPKNEKLKLLAIEYGLLNQESQEVKVNKNSIDEAILEQSQSFSQTSLEIPK